MHFCPGSNGSPDGWGPELVHKSLELDLDGALAIAQPGRKKDAMERALADGTLHAGICWMH